MTYKEFEKLLDDAELLKTNFAELADTPYSTIMSWNNNNTVPSWTLSWIENYKKAKSIDTIVNALLPLINNQNK